MNYLHHTLDERSGDPRIGDQGAGIFSSEGGGEFLVSHQRRCRNKRQ